MADKTADIRGLAGSAHDSTAKLRSENLKVTVPNGTIGDFLHYEDTALAYCKYDYNATRKRYILGDYVKQTDLKEVSNVAIVEAPIQNFTAELDEGSKNTVYPDSSPST